MRYLLDTNICIYLIRQKPLHVTEHFTSHAVGDVGISTISVAELFFGVQKSKHQTQNEQALIQFLTPLVIVDFDRASAVAYGKIRAALQFRGTPIGSLDTLIAAHALSLGVTLVTNNIREFSRVPKLKLENWADNN
jgi:tRNA(fMet)-specific endonuclease VapC